MRETWTDERLDDLSQGMTEGFKGIGADLRSVRGEIGGLRSEMNVRFERVDARFDTMNDSVNARFDAMNEGFNARFDAMQRTMVQVGGGIIAALLGTMATLIATQL